VTSTTASAGPKNPSQAIGEAGAANAAILAAEILALSDEALAGRIQTMRQSMAARILAP